jgi:hypothetical protein
MRQCGRNSKIKKTPNVEHRIPNSDSELDVECWVLDVRRL